MSNVTNLFLNPLLEDQIVNLWPMEWMNEEWKDNEDILQVPRSTVKALITSKSGWLDQVGRQLVDICVHIVGIGIILRVCRHVPLR